MAQPVSADHAVEATASPQVPREALRLQDALAGYFATPFTLHATRHFVVMHDTDARRAAARARLLEQTHGAFFDAFADADLRPLRQPLLCVLFTQQEDFTHYARQVDRIDMSWSGGYYSSRTNRVALYEADDWFVREDPTFDETDSDTAPADSGAASPSPRISLASTTHEAAHQLAFNTGLQKRGVMYPFWASEGLATAFESARLSQPLGPAHDNPARRYELNEAWRDGRLLPLETFITMTRVPTENPGMINTVYAQAWGLFRHLFQHDRIALMGYLATLAQLDTGPRSPETLRAEFEAAFGPIHEVEQRWHADLAANW